MYYSPILLRRSSAALAGAAAWLALYLALAPASRWLTYDLLRLEPGRHLSAAMEFFVFETPKVLLLLTLVVFAVGIVRSYFTPERTRRMLAGRREATGNVLSVPAMENVGELRTGAAPEADRTYFMIFGNPGRLVKSGSRVSVVAGALHIDGLIVD